MTIEEYIIAAAALSLFYAIVGLRWVARPTTKLFDSGPAQSCNRRAVVIDGHSKPIQICYAAGTTDVIVNVKVEGEPLPVEIPDYIDEDMLEEFVVRTIKQRQPLKKIRDFALVEIFLAHMRQTICAGNYYTPEEVDADFRRFCSEHRYVSIERQNLRSMLIDRPDQVEHGVRRLHGDQFAVLCKRNAEKFASKKELKSTVYRYRPQCEVDATRSGRLVAMHVQNSPGVSRKTPTNGGQAPVKAWKNNNNALSADTNQRRYA